jgi:hypothetical protein
MLVREDARAGGYLTTGRPCILFLGDNIPPVYALWCLSMYYLVYYCNVHTYFLDESTARPVMAT